MTTEEPESSDGAAVRFVEPGEQAKQGRLPRPVGPNEADPRPRGDRPRQATEKRERAELTRYAVEADHCPLPIALPRWYVIRRELYSP